MAWGARNLISTQVTNVHRIGETIGDAWPLVAVDRVHRGGKWARDRQTFNKNKKHLTDHDAVIQKHRMTKQSRAVWKSNFGRPTPSTRRWPRDRVGSMASRSTQYHTGRAASGLLLLPRAKRRTGF